MTFDDSQVEAREQVLDEISEVLAWAKSHRWGARAEQALCAAALAVSGSLLWHEKRRYEQVNDQLTARWERVKQRQVSVITEALAREEGST